MAGGVASELSDMLASGGEAGGGVSVLDGVAAAGTVGGATAVPDEDVCVSGEDAIVPAGGEDALAS